MMKTQPVRKKYNFAADVSHKNRISQDDSWSRMRDLRGALAKHATMQHLSKHKKINVFEQSATRNQRKLDAFRCFCALQGEDVESDESADMHTRTTKIKSFAQQHFVPPFFTCISLQTYEEK